MPPPSAPRAMAAQSPRLGGRAEASPVVAPREKDQDKDRDTRDRGERAVRGERSLPERETRADRPPANERDDKEKDRSDRAQKSEREWKEGPGKGPQNGAPPTTSLGSLRDRISMAPVAASSPRDEYNDKLKRSVSERDREGLQGSTTSVPSAPPPAKAPSKRIRIDRSRIGGDGGSGRRTLRQ